MHVAQQLLDATVQAVTGLATTGTNVFRDRPDNRSLTAAEMPALLVYLGGEDVTPATLDNLIMQRDERIRIGLRVKQTSDSDDVLCAIRVEVENALQAQLTVGLGVLVRLNYTGMADPEYSDDSEQPVASAEMEFTAQLFTTSADTIAGDIVGSVMWDDGHTLWDDGTSWDS